MEFISQNIDSITLIIAIFSGLFAFIKWIDSRNRELKNERYKKYMQLIREISGSKETEGASICITEQIASSWMLLEYKEYHKITLKILDNEDLKKMSNDRWQKFVLPQIKKVIEEIRYPKKGIVNLQ